MPSLDSTLTRAYLAGGLVQQAVTDTPVVIRMRYVSTGTVTSVTVTTATNIVTVSVEASGTVTKTYAFSSYATIGAVIDAINADGLFDAKILDGLRSDASASTIVTGAITSGTDANGTVIWDAKADTSALKSLTACITGNRDFGSNYKVKYQNSPTHRVHLQEVKYFVTLGGAGANLVNIYLRRNGNIETLLWTGTSVSATATTINWAAGMGKISGHDGDEIIARISDGTSIADAAGNFFTAAGYVE